MSTGSASSTAWSRCTTPTPWPPASQRRAGRRPYQCETTWPTGAVITHCVNGQSQRFELTDAPLGDGVVLEQPSMSDRLHMVVLLGLGLIAGIVITLMIIHPWA
ncbi:hypothetical protein GTY54_34400 [Streptomyces sp. SID625]|nr:hypothetical protein [Streptomyces sp. SID625]